MRARRWLAVVLVVLGAGTALAPGPAAAQTAPVRDIHVPVAGPVSFRDDFGAPRDGGARTHLGNDIFAPKLTHLLAAADGTVSSIVTGTSRAGNQLTITGVDGWRYLYVHLNNDTPGTDDGANPRHWMLAPGVGVGTLVRAGQHVAYQGDSGNAEGELPQLHFEIRTPSNVAINPYQSLLRSRGLGAGSRCAPDQNPADSPSAAAGPGYWLVARDGTVLPFGSASHLGDMAGQVLNRPIVGATATPTGRGYWLFANDGGVFAFGDARFHGSTGALRLNRPIVGATATPTGRGYWLFANDGGVFAFGDAGFHGSTGAVRLNRPVVGAAATPGGLGYWLVADDGGVFAFGDATFHGSTGGQRLAQRVTGMDRTRTGDGYTLVAGDGGAFTFGDARFHGSVPGSGSCGPFGAPGIAATATDAGSWIPSGDGRVVPLGDAPDHGDAWDAGLQPAVVALVPQRH
ncbi:MAG: M23 family metallopeptidase [Acidimicrobiales bacterium]